LVDTVHEVAIAAIRAIPAVAAKEPDPDALTSFPAFDALARRVDPSHRLMAWNSWPLDRQ